MATDHAPLHLCPACASRLVHPTRWEATPHGRWRVSLRCPECEWSSEGVYAEERVQAFEDQLLEGDRLLGDALARLQADRLAPRHPNDAVRR